jgi:two-component system, chemotaxis family, protein-glutamate methylesterase/glutaminase
MKKKVLIVDDSFMMRRILSDIIEMSDTFEVCDMAENGREALILVKKHRPDYILLDIEMPEMNGVEFLKRVPLISQAKVIVVSFITNDVEMQKMMLMKYGAAAVVSKPSGSLSLSMDEDHIMNALMRLEG